MSEDQFNSENDIPNSPVSIQYRMPRPNRLPNWRNDLLRRLQTEVHTQVYNQLQGTNMSLQDIFGRSLYADTSQQAILQRAPIEQLNAQRNSTVSMFNQIPMVDLNSIMNQEIRNEFNGNGSQVSMGEEQPINQPTDMQNNLEAASVSLATSVPMANSVVLNMHPMTMMNQVSMPNAGLLRYTPPMPNQLAITHLFPTRNPTPMPIRHSIPLPHQMPIAYPAPVRNQIPIRNVAVNPNGIPVMNSMPMRNRAPMEWNRAAIPNLFQLPNAAPILNQTAINAPNFTFNMANSPPAAERNISGEPMPKKRKYTSN